MALELGTSLITVRIDSDVAEVALSRADRRNALNRQMLQDLTAVAARVSDREDLRAVIFSAEGEDFSVGADLKEVGSMETDGSLLRARRDAELGQTMLQAIRSMHQPTICELKGIATGGGACIAAACDFRIADSTTRLGLGEVKVGMNLMWHAVPLFVEQLGLSRAKQLIMSGDLIEASILSEWGMIDEVCAPDDLKTAVAAWAAKYAALPPVAVQMIKRSINQYALALSDAVMHMDSDQWILAARSDDFRESIAAFIEKRAPHTTGH